MLSVRTKDKPLSYLAITTGEPAGIGPDICCSLAAQPSFPGVIYGCPDLIAKRAKQLNLTIKIALLSEQAPFCGEGVLTIKPIAGCNTKTPGILDSTNAPYIFAQLDAAIEDCLTKKAFAMVTAPVHKGNLSTPKQLFQGHTEYLAHKTQQSRVSMQFANNHLLAGLVTVHEPLASVPASLTIEKVIEKLTDLYAAHRYYFPEKTARIGVLGLNPHAGENGLLGEEEQAIVIPAIHKFTQQTKDCIVEGPLSPDAAFMPETLTKYNALLGMYHDQVLIPLKALYPRHLVNVTWGLPFMRASVDHGTALAIAGSGQADPSSLLFAIRFALEHAHVS